MEDIKIKHEPGKPYQPSVDFSVETGICSISGESYMENPSEFYEPIVKWLKEYLQTCSSPLQFNIKMSFFNTRTSRYLAQIMSIFKNFRDQGKEVLVYFYHEKDDDEMKEEAEDLMIETGMDITMKSF